MQGKRRKKSVKYSNVEGIRLDECYKTTYSRITVPFVALPENGKV